MNRKSKKEAAVDAKHSQMSIKKERVTELESNETSRAGVFIFTLFVFTVASSAAFLATYAFISPFSILGSAIAGLLCASCIRIAPQWERVVILRMGRFNPVAGPGLYVIIPLFEYVTIHIDQRVMNSSFTAEEALTADLVPVDVDAILFWLVWDSERASLEVRNYPRAVLRSAQTALRDAIGQTNLADLSLRRKQIDHELEATLGKKCADWGISVLSVEIRDIMIPEELQDALSREAQAERERDARLILAEVEKDISEMFVEAANVYNENPKAMQLRAMNLVYEGAKSSKGMFVIPSQLVEAFNLSDQIEKAIID